MAAPSSTANPSCKTFEKCKWDHNRDPNPKKAVLLVIDMQNYFAPLAKPIIPNIKTTIQVCQNAGIPVIYTRICKRADDEGGVLGEWWNGKLIIDGTPESELIPEVVTAAGTNMEVEVIEKQTYGAFRNTRLEERLLEMGAEEVIITGVMTNLCCETTAREAFVRDFRVFFSTDATATETDELHEASLKNLAHGFAYLVDCKRLSQFLAS